MSHLVAPSLLSADFAQLNSTIELLDKSDADWVHLDVMDGHFVPNFTFGMMIVKAINSLTQKPLDVHLMIAQPERYIEQFRQAGADIITVHYEACTHVHRIVQQIKDTGAKAGVALNPATPVVMLEDILEMLDVVLIMSVNPGFGGQKFIYHTIPKIRKLRQMLEVHNAHALIEVDGGIGLQNAEEVLRAGARILVAGSSIFGSSDPLHTIAQMKQIDSQRYFV